MWNDLKMFILRIIVLKIELVPRCFGRKKRHLNIFHFKRDATLNILEEEKHFGYICLSYIF